jgi:hypothetical protein
MLRSAKTFAQPERPDDLAPVSNLLSLDLMGLNLTDAQLAKVNSAAVKAALSAAAEALGGQSTRPNVLEEFGTFSTFQTFSTFGSGVSPAARETITRVVGDG